MLLAEQLTRNFYLWERRGRGWQVWPYPVELEPPHLPFFHFAAPQPVIDDARQATFFSSLLDRLSRSKSQAEKSPETSAIDPEEYFTDIPAFPFADDEGLNHFSLVLPPEQKISLASAQHFLLALNYLSYPLSFELIGQAETTTVQVTTRHQDADVVRQQLAAYFPEAAILETSDQLEPVWELEGDRASLVVDFGLSQEFMRPLKTMPGLETDLLIGVAAALEGLQPAEVGFLQVLFQPARQSWAEDVLRAVTDGEGHSFFADAPEMIHLAQAKVANPLFAAVIRIGAQSPQADRATKIVKALGGALHQLANPPSNELIPLNNDAYDDLTHRVDVLLRQSHRSGLLLNCQELVSIVHPPSPSVKAPNLLRQVGKSKPAPAITHGHDLMLGENLHQGQKNTVTLSTKHRLQHTYIIGATGTGKSTLLLNMIVQDIRSGHGVGLLDPYGDLVDQVMRHVPRERFRDVVLFDPSDTDYPVGFNILSAHSEVEKTLLASDLVAVFRRLSTSWGDQMTSVLGNAILAFLESQQGGTLLDLRRFLIEPKYRQGFLDTVTDQEVSYFWQKQFPLLGNKSLGPILTRLDTFLRPKLIRYLVAQKQGLDFEDILNTQKIFLAKLPHGLIGEENAYLLGTLLVGKLHQMVLGRQALAASARKPFFLYLDEFQNFVTPSLSVILSGARKYSLGLVLAHQELRQLWNKDTELANSVLSNPFTRVCFRLGDFDAQKLQDGFAYFKAEDLQNLGLGQAIVRVERKDFDFNLQTPPPPIAPDDFTDESVADLIQVSRSKYATQRAELDSLLADHTSQASQPDQLLGKKVAQPKKSAPQDDSITKAVPPPRPKRSRLEPPGASGQASLSRVATKFLESIWEADYQTTTNLPEVLGLTPDEISSLAESLTAQGLIETVAGKSLHDQGAFLLTKKGLGLIERPAPLGRGGPQHKYLQQLIKRLAEEKGYKVTIEKAVKDAQGQVDVVLKGGGKKIACEISVTTSEAQEISNIQKCLDAGFDQVIILAPEKLKLNKIEQLAKQAVSSSDLSRLLFLQPEGFVDFLDCSDSAPTAKEELVKGYKVKVNYRAVEDKDKQARRQAVAKVILQAFKRMAE